MTDPIPDNAHAVRDEDAFDPARLAKWLRANISDGITGLDGVPEVRQFAGGASNLTYLLCYPERDLVLRRPPAGKKPTSGHDMVREFRIQSLLRPVYPYVPTMLALCTDRDVLGADFYVMDRVPGIVLRGTPGPELNLDEGRAKTLCTNVIDLLVELHGVDPLTTGLDEFSRGPGYVHRQVQGWAKRYRVAITPNVPDFADVISWLEANEPEDVANVVIHGDFRLDNMVLDSDDPLTPRAVLDWELATIGDPLMDLGSSLAYWVQADDDDLFKLNARQPTYISGMLTRREVVQYWSERTGIAVDNWEFYEVFGLFRLAAIAQQIYLRYHNKQTTNPAFKDFWIAVAYLNDRIAKIIAG